jgi:hypothetical protein
MPKTAPSRKPRKPGKPPESAAAATKRKPSPIDRLALMQDVLFFAFFFFFLWLRVEPRLIFHGGWNIPDFPVFYKGAFFFNEHLARPGGLVEYAAKALSQLLYHSWTGALVITLQAWLISACAGFLIGEFISPRLRALRFVPSAVLLALYSLYTFHFITVSALAVALIFICLAVKIRFSNGALDFAVMMTLPAVLYMLDGAAVFVFALPCALHAWLVKSRRLSAMACLLTAVALPFLAGNRAFGLTLQNAFTTLTPLSAKILQFHPRGLPLVYALYLFFGLIALGMIVRRAHGPADPPAGAALKPARPRLKMTWVLETVILLAIAVAAGLLAFDRKQKTLLEVDYYAYHRMWSRVLETAGDHPQSDFVMAAVDRALARTGRLGDSEIALRQMPGTLLLNADKYKYSFWFQFDIFLDLGFINRADHQLTEALDYYGERPQILQRLGLVNMVKGNTGTARIYLGALSRMPFYADAAKARIEELDTDSTLAGDAEVQALRSSMLRVDRVREQSFDGLFIELLGINPRNRMAFEYLMTFYLLTMDLENFILNLDRIKYFDYPRMPRLFEQAVLLCAKRPDLNAKIREMNLTPNGISEDSRKLYFDFLRIVNEIRTRRNAAAIMEFPETLKDSYFVYYYLNAQSEKKEK